MGTQNLGIYSTADVGTSTVLALVDETGAAVDLTNATDIKLRAASAERDTFSLAGALSGVGTLGKVAFAALASAFTPTAARPIVWFEAYVEWVQGADTFRSRDAVRFAIARLP